MKVLIAVDETKGSKATIEAYGKVFSGATPNAVLLYVETAEGRLMDEMLGEPELATLKEALKDTDYQKAMDKKASKVLDSFKKALEKKGAKGIKTIIKSGHPAEVIISIAKEEKADLIIVGSRGRRLQKLLLGSVSREVTNNSEISVLIAK